jgi:hypothetical protein
MRGLNVLAATLVAAMPFVALADPVDNRLRVTCTVLDVNDQPKSIFAPGEEFLPRVFINVPAHRSGNKVRLEGFLSAKIKGIRFGTQLADNVVEVPNRAVRLQVPGWKQGYEDVVDDGFTIENWNLGLANSYKIPEQFPEGAATLRISATFAQGSPDEVTKRCEQTIRIVR